MKYKIIILILFQFYYTYFIIHNVLSLCPAQTFPKHSCQEREGNCTQHPSSRNVPKKKQKTNPGLPRNHLQQQCRCKHHQHPSTAEFCTHILFQKCTFSVQDDLSDFELSDQLLFLGPLEVSLLVLSISDSRSELCYCR